MKLISGILLLVLLICGSSSGQSDGIVSIDRIEGLYSGDTLYAGTPIRFVIKFNNNTGRKCDAENGFRLSSPDGATWDSLTMDSAGSNVAGHNLFAKYFSVAFFLERFSDGLSPDTVGLLASGKTLLSNEQMPAGYNDSAIAVTAWFSNYAADGKHICLDSSFYQPGGEWMWVDDTLGKHYPVYSGLPGQTYQPGGGPDRTGSGYCFALVNLAHHGTVSIDHVEGLLNGDTVLAGGPVRMVLRLNNNTGSKCDLANGFRLSSPDGASWDSLTIDSIGPIVAGANEFGKYFSIVFSFQKFTDGVSPDTVGFLGAGKGTRSYEQMPAGFDDTAFAITAWISNGSGGGKHICLDSSFFQPGGEWMWVDQSLTRFYPSFVGLPGQPYQPGTGGDRAGSGYCFTLVTVAGFATTPTKDTSDVYYFKQADLDMDNNTDFVYTGSTSDSLYIVYGKSDGTLEKPRGYYKIKQAALTVDYINGDTLLDIVARTATQVYTMLNSGNREFTLDSLPVTSFGFRRAPLNSSLPSISTGFVNGDAYKDIIVSPGTVLYGNGSGQFPTRANLPITFDAVAAADFNGDGFDDLVVTMGDSAKVFLNNGSGTMTQSSATRIGYHTFDVSSIVSGVDFNKDGKVDFVVVTGQSAIGPHDTSLVTVGLGNGSGGIQSKDTLPIQGSAINIAVNDVNRDQNLDITVINAQTRNLEIYTGNGQGQFPDSASSPLGTGSQPLLVLATADLNRDGNPDYLTGGESTPIVTSTNQTPPEAVLPEEMVVTGYGGIDFTVKNPLDNVISQNLSTVAGSAFWRADIDHDSKLDERSFDYNLLNGEYKLIIRFPPYFSPGSHFTMDIRVDGSQQTKLFQNYNLNPTLAFSTQATDSLVFYYTEESKPSMNPPNGMKTRSQMPAFLWGKLLDTSVAAKYEFQLSPNYDLSAPLYDDTTLNKPQYVMRSQLDTGKVYYWRARALAGSSWSNWTRTMAAYVGPGCCNGFRGNVNGTGIVDLGDLSLLVCYLTTIGICTLPCPDAANVNGIGIIDLSDLAALVSYLTGGGFILPPCP